MSKPSYEELVDALRRVDSVKGHTMHKPAGGKAFSAAVLPRDVTDHIEVLLTRVDHGSEPRSVSAHEAGGSSLMGGLLKMSAERADQGMAGTCYTT